MRTRVKLSLVNNLLNGHLPEGTLNKIKNGFDANIRSVLSTNYTLKKGISSENSLQSMPPRPNGSGS